MRPRIVQAEGQLGFGWTGPDGTPTRLPRLVAVDDEPVRLVATHLAALDDALIIAAERFGELLGGGRAPTGADRDALLELHRCLDGLVADYATGAELAGVAPDVAAGQIVGTATLLSLRARQPLGLLGPPPFEGELDTPGMGVIGGFGEMCQLDPDRPWRGGRWVLRTEGGQRFPLTLAMVLFDSSGTNTRAAEQEHREAIATVVAAAEHPDADPFAVACALDWLVYDLLMARREGQDSAAIVLGRNGVEDATAIVSGAATSARARARVDPGLAATLT